MKSITPMPGIRAARRRRGLTVAEAASGIGVVAATWYDWERGKYTPSGGLLPAMAELLGCEIGALYEAPPGGADEGEEAGAS